MQGQVRQGMPSHNQFGAIGSPISGPVQAQHQLTHFQSPPPHGSQPLQMSGARDQSNNAPRQRLNEERKQGRNEAKK